MAIETINPTTGEPLERYEETTPGALETILTSAVRSQAAWAQREVAERVQPLVRVAELLRRDREDHARLMAEEMGKPLPGGRAEVDKCAWVCEYYADNADAFLADEPVATDAARSYVTFRPLGVVLAIMPWNFPFWQVLRFAAPALAAGNGVLLKHAPSTTGCGLALEALFAEAGFPEDLFRTVVLAEDRIEGVIGDHRVAAVTLTGSVGAGRAVAAQAGAALKKVVLELGGSDPYVLLEDADVAAAAETCVASRLLNSGQSCIAAKRLIVPAALRETFEQQVVAGMEGKRMGDPLKEGTEIGPQARHELRDALHRQVVESVERGARCLLGGEIPDGPGAFYPPTVLTDIGPGMPAYEEELFGPVAAILPVADEKEALAVAGDTSFGLGAAIFTADATRGEELAARHLEAGSCFVNAFVKSDPRLPFGGIKDSGYGRELAAFGIREFVNVKTVYVGR